MGLAERVTGSRPRNMTAYVEYLKGWYMMKKRRPNDVRRAFEYFQEAIRLEPDYVEPYNGAAMYYIVSAMFLSAAPPSALPRPKTPAAKGAGLHDEFAMLAALRTLAMFQWRWAESGRCPPARTEPGTSEMHSPPTIQSVQSSWPA